jgi:PAS domain S-box-containing protein
MKMSDLINKKKEILPSFELDSVSYLEHGLFNVMTDIVAVVAVDYSYVYVNDAFCEFFGKERSQIVGTKILDNFDDNLFKEKIKENIDECLVGKTRVSTKINFDLDSNGARFLNLRYYPQYQADGTISRVIIRAQSVSEEISDKNEGWRDVINSVNNILFIINDEFVIEDINDNGLVFLNKKYQEVVGAKCCSLFHNSNDPIDDCPLCKFQKAQIKKIIEIRFKLFDKNVLAKFVPICNVDGKNTKSVVLISEVMDDITTDEKLKELSEQYENLASDYKVKSDELIVANEDVGKVVATKSEIFYDLYQEIRSPLNSIMCFSDYLKKEDLSFEKRKYYAGIIRRSCDQLNRIVLDMSEQKVKDQKQGKAKFTDVNLNELLLEMFTVFQLKAVDQKIVLHLFKPLPDSESWISTDEGVLWRVLSYMLENAIMFTFTGSIEFGYRIDDDEIQFFVKDTGVGISFEKRGGIIGENLIDNNLIDGVDGGFGLHVIKENAELIGGRASMESHVDEGTTISINIPFKHIIRKGKDIPNSQFNINVLIVEDEELNYFCFEALLRKIDSRMNPIYAKNGQEAVDIVRSRDIDIGFVDLRMPVMNGFEAAIEIRKFNSDVFLIAQTGYSSDKERKKSIDAGFNEFVSKPINIKKLSGIMKRYFPSEK